MVIYLLPIFIIISIYFAYRYFSLYYDIKAINKRLKLLNKTETNLLVDSLSMNKEAIKLAKLINQNLKDINAFRSKINHEEAELRNTIANISHDLRTPITSILGYLQLFQSSTNLSDKQANYLEIITSRIHNLKQLIENLFSYSIVYDTIDLLNLKQENINLILEDSIAMYYQDLITKKITPVIEIPDQPIYKNVDKLALKRVFNNLISNILKYGVGSMKISITDEKIIFENKTNSYDQIDVGKIFDRFFTVAQARNNNSMGIGLAISKSLIEKMNGKIEASLDSDTLAITIYLEN